MLAAFNNRLAAREHLDGFEKRFTRAADGTLFLEEDGSAVRLTDATAADLIAAMRAEVTEADGRSSIPRAQLGWWMAGAAGGAVLLGVGLGLPGLGWALALPAAVAVVLLGPGLDALRIEAAASHGLLRARAAMADCERIEAGDLRAIVPANRIRPVMEVGGLLLGAVVLGLLLAYVTLPFYARIRMDRALVHVAPTVLLVMAVLVFAARARDAFTRRRVTEAAIGEATSARGGHPFR
jgi:hypothetical protein